MDAAGKSATDPKIHACVLTKEVEKGGQMINQARAENGLPAIELVFTSMILFSDEAEQKYTDKMSSTLIRSHLASLKAK